jgi:VCBS repeat-containing protein
MKQIDTKSNRLQRGAVDSRSPLLSKTHLTRAVGVAIATTVLGGCVVKPEAISTSQSLKSAAIDAAILVSEAQQINQVIDLNQAIARALKHNRSRRISLMEAALASNNLDVAHFDMLPKLSARAGYKERDRLSLSASGTYESATGEFNAVTPPVSTASAYEISHTVDLEMTWNVLDFGLSYVRAGQQADRYLISKERERKAIHNLITDVRAVYWRAASAQRLLKKIKPLMEQVDLALSDSRGIEEQRLQSPIEALTYQRELLDIRRSLESLHKDLKDATTTLATLMGMKPGQSFELEGIEKSGYKVLDVKLDLETLEKTALAKRPELMERRYQKRITLAESRAALLALLPGIDLSYGGHRDENSFLLYNNWEDWGAKISFNLFNLFKAPAIQNKVESDKAVEEARRLALSASVISQVHLAAIAYEQSKQEFTTASEYLNVVERLRDHIRAQRDAERSGGLSLIREELSSVLAQLRRDVSYASLQNSYGRIFTTAGLDPLPENLENDQINTITSALKTQFELWKEGEVGLVATPLEQQIAPWQGPGDHQFAFSEETFSLGGNIAYQVKQHDGSALPNWMHFDPITRQLSGNPPASTDRVEIQVKAVNESGAKASDRFTLALEETNDAPTASAGEIHQVKEDGAIIRGNIASMDADGDPLHFQVAANQSLPAGLNFKKEGSWSFNPADVAYQSLAEGEKATQTIKLNVTDPYGGTGEAILTIEITGTNDAPTIESVVKIELKEDGESQNGTLQIADPDNRSSITFKAMNKNLPAGFTLKENGSWAFNPKQAEYQPLKQGDIRSQFVMVQATDEYSLSDNSQMQFTLIGSNDAPIISEQPVTPIQLNEGNRYQRKLPDNLFTEQEGEAITLKVEQSGLFGAAPLPKWISYDQTTQMIRAESGYEGIKSSKVTLLITATDPHGATASRRIALDLRLPDSVEIPTEVKEASVEKAASLDTIPVMIDVENHSMEQVTTKTISVAWWNQWDQAKKSDPVGK